MKLRIYLKSFSKNGINETLKGVIITLSKLKLNFSSISLPTHIKKFCVLRSPHVNKDSREEFEIRIYKKFIDILPKNNDDIRRLFIALSGYRGVSCQFNILNI